VSMRPAGGTVCPNDAAHGGLPMTPCIMIFGEKIGDFI
jgi:hypothetical protein